MQQHQWKSSDMRQDWLCSNHLPFSSATCRGKNCQVRLKVPATAGFHVPHLESSEWTYLLFQRSHFDQSGLLFPQGGIKEFGWERTKWLLLKENHLFKFEELPPYPTLLAEEMANQTFILVCTVRRWLNSSMFLDWQDSSKLFLYTITSTCRQSKKKNIRK